MGVAKQMKEQNKTSTGKKKQETKGRPRFITFHPTEAEKGALLIYSGSVEKYLDRICEVIMLNVSFTIQFKPENAAYGLTLRDKSKNWDEDVPLSVWHSDLWKALAALSYALETRWEGYPSVHPADYTEFTDLW